MLLPFCILTLLTWSVHHADASGFGLVARQSDCKIRCENGGMCAFSFEDESLHSCICLMGVYEGERCQYQVGEDPSKIKAEERARKDKLEESQNLCSSNATVLTEQQKLEEETKRREEERQNAERRRIYEIKIREEEAKRRAEQERSAAAGAKAADLERQKEILRRQEEVKRREEERRRYDEERRRIQTERERDEMVKENRKNEENRRIIEEKRVREEEEQKLQELQQQEQVLEPELEEDLGDDDMEPDATGEEWNYEDENKDDAVKEDVMDNKSTEADNEWTDDKNVQEMSKKEENSVHPKDKNPFGALADVIEKAADMTLKEHSSIITETEKENGDMHESEDDYWDHHPKKETEEYEVPKVMDSEEEDEIKRDQLNPQKDASNTREFATEESEDGDGWMMVSRTESQESFVKQTNIMISLALLLAYYIV